MVRLRAFCASSVMASHSSSTMTLNGGMFRSSPEVPTACAANVFTAFLTTLIPRSSLAFSSSTLLAYAPPNIERHTAMASVVLPVPGGP